MALQFAVNGEKWAVTSPAPRYDPNVNSDWNTYWTMKRLELAGTPTSRLPAWIKQQMGLSSDVTTGTVPGSGQQTTVPTTSTAWAPPGAAPNFAPTGNEWGQLVQGVVGRWTGSQFNPADPQRSIDAMRQVAMNIQPGTALANELSRDITWLNNALNRSPDMRNSIQAPTWYQNNQSVSGPNGNTTVIPGPQTGTPGTTVPTLPTVPIVPGSGTQTQPPAPTTPTTSTGTTPPTGTGTGTGTTSGGTSTPTTPTTNAGSSMTTPPTTGMTTPPITGTPTYPQTPVTPQLPWIPQYESGQGPNYPVFYPTLEANPNVWSGLTDEQVQRALAYYSGMLPYAELAESSRRNDEQFAWTKRADAAALTGRQQLPNTRQLRRFY